jgi:hypothetical protein
MQKAFLVTFLSGFQLGLLGFAGALRNLNVNIGKESCCCKRNFTQSPLSPILPLPMRSIPRKRKGEDCFVVLCVLFVAYRFLSIRMISAPTTMMATIMPIDAGTMYWSATDAGGGVGVGVGDCTGASSTVMKVCADDGP